MPVSFQCSTGHTPAYIVLYPQYLGSGRVGTASVEELGYVPSVCMCVYDLALGSVVNEPDKCIVPRP